MKSASPPETVHDQYTKGRSWQSIQGRLYLVLLILLVPTLLIQAYAYYDRFQERRAEELQANLEIARSVAKTFDAFIQDILHEELVMGLAITASGSITSKDITRLLEQAQLGQAAVRDFSWVDRDGQFLYSSNPAMVGSNNSDRAYFRDIAGGHEWTVGELVLARTTGKPVFGITRGIRDDHGALLGLVVATVIPERLDALLAVERGKGGAISIVDHKGMLVYRYPALQATWEDRDWLREYPEYDDVLRGKEVAKTVYAGYEGKKRIVGLVPIGSIGWVAGAGRTEEIALEAVTSSLLPEAALFLLIILAALGAALGLSRFISTPVKRLRNHALALGRGEKDDLPPVSGPAELQDLADAIRMMAREIRSRETEIISLAQDAQQRAAEAEEGKRVIETIMDAVPAAIWVADDPECNFMTGNRTAYELLKMEPGSNISKTAPEGERPVHFKAVKDGVEIPLGELPVQMAAKGKAIRDYEFELWFDNSESRYVFGNAAPLINKQGEAYGSVAAFMDITDRKRAEASLREAHERAVWLARFPEENPSPVIRVSAEGNILYRNRAAAELPEWMCEVDKLLPGALLPLVGQALRELGEVHQDVELSGRCYSVSITPFPAERYANVYGHDITERNQAEEALRNSETRFRLLSETASVLLASEHPQGVVNELCRKVMEHLDCHAFFNFLADERVGRLHLNAWAGIPEEEAKKIEWLDYGVAVCGCAAQQGRRIVAENIQTTPDLRTELVKSYGIQAYACHPLMAQGRVRGTLSFGARTRTHFSPQDLALMETVTTQVATAMERIRLIGDLKTSRDELEIRVQERTAELRKMNEALKQSNRDLEDFAYVASHDLQEPLRKIQTFADWLVAEQQESLNEKVRDYLERMRRAAGRMQALVQDLLRYSRLTSKPEPFTRFSLSGPVEEAILDLEVLREETEGHVQVEELPDIEADRVQMRQLFQNLISNGLKYHGDQKPVVKVYSHSSSSPGFWEIHVKDNGIGFDEGYLDRIFKPFQRLHGRSAPYQGTGIGLAICRRIVERHGGSITAESKPGEGATFIVQLPKKRLISEMKH